MILLRNLTLRRGAKALIEGANATLHTGMRVGVVGPNGCGKSTLFAALRGEIHADVGDIEIPPRWVIAQVAQETPALEIPAIDYVLDGDAELREIERDIALAETDAAAGERLGLLHDRYHAIGGYAARARAAGLLSGLGFAASDHERQVREFSGGWRMRLNVARALMTRSDLLLLDEPTNHLDLDAIYWLERWLADYRGTLFVIAHDREFLDTVANAVLSFEGGQLRLYSGGYSDFENARAERLARERALYERQQREVEHLENFIRRFRAKATKARQAQSRIKALERMERIAPAHVDSPFSFSFREFPGSPDPVLRLEDAAIGYGETPILDGVNLSLQAGARIGLLGANGAGKSTLVKLLAGRLAPLAGKRIEGKGLRVGYFAQHQLEELRSEDGALAHLMRLDPQTREQELRDFLGGFDFGGDAALRPAGELSGGERARLALALLLWQRPNLLLLDEPTNHLDLEMREALTLALQDYEGAMVLVSHDRHLLRTTVDALHLVADGRVQPFDGDLDDYRAWLMERRAPAKPREETGASRRDERRAQAEARNERARQRKPLADQAKKIEKEMDRLGREKVRLDALLAAAELYTPEHKDRLKSALLDQAQVKTALDAAEAEWLALQEQLEGMEPL